MTLSRRRVSDLSALKALAHPVRVDLLELLMVHGAHTASEAGRELDQTPANCSWHLRKLAEHGFVRQVTSGPGRSRPWRAVTEGLTWGDPDDDATTTAAGEALTDVLLEREIQRFRAARASSERESQSWRDATRLQQARLWVTAEEAAQLGDALRDLLRSYGDRITDPTTRPDDARLVSLVAWLAPSAAPASRTQGSAEPTP